MKKLKFSAKAGFTWNTFIIIPLLVIDKDFDNTIYLYIGWLFFGCTIIFERGSE